MLDDNPIATILYFGFVPESASGQFASLCDWSMLGECKKWADHSDVASLIDEGVASLKVAFRHALAGIDAGKTHVLPLSGGLDSRAILGSLLDNVDHRQIQAVTFGTPGTWDYEIGRRVAQAAGVRHESIDLTSSQWKWSSAELIETAAKTERVAWVFDAHVNRHVPERFGRSPVYWSGFMGEALAGAHLPPCSSASWTDAKSYFVSWNRHCRSINLWPPHFKPEDKLPAVPFCDREVLSYDDQLDFAIRQQNLIRHIVLPAQYDYRTPFLQTEWLRFILNVPRCCRQRQHLYKEVLRAAYPRLFSLPAKNSYGLPLKSPHWRQYVRRQGLRLRAAAKRFVPWIDWGTSPSINYMDFDRGLRERADLKTVIYENMQDLKKRGVIDWINVDTIWKRHHEHRGNHADALTLLASLEISLKSGLLNAS
jgi:hypothetical protein